ncbi:hypothetical protein MNBD_UNCLBAC01-444 [hydrothermal vent metagenome]|uniref:Uncharacterized protein n=1 Tax=hydrothermal vent metagenome TaxID=652676 RepID=A0A3B1D9U8_9ZZZZ
MEYVNSIKLKDIFLSNGNWWKLFLKRREFIRLWVILNVIKLLVCRTRILGCHIFKCPKCHHTLKVYHTCKSRFCPSCGKRATDDWIKNSYNRLPNTTWQHITFTMPDKLWNLFWENRYLMNLVPPIAANIILDTAKKKGFLPGIFLAVHTFGRDLKRNFHIHLSTTLCGLSLSRDSWINKPAFFHHQSLKNIWRYKIILLLRNEFKKGNLKMPPELKHIKSFSTFNSWSAQFYNYSWVVFLNESSNNLKRNVEYLGKYIKRPPIGETRIKRFKNNLVSFEFLDHYTKSKNLKTIPALDFISHLIDHIPNKYFRVIRYYGFLANRVRSKLLPIVFYALHFAKSFLIANVYTPYRNLIKSSFGFDPFICPNCSSTLKLSGREPPLKGDLISLHKRIAVDFG